MRIDGMNRCSSCSIEIVDNSHGGMCPACFLKLDGGRLDSGNARESEEVMPARDLRQVTILFSDIVNFSGLNEKLGDRDASQIVNRVLEIQKEIVQRDGGGQIKNMTGDGIMASFGSPSVAMSRALDIQRELKELSPTGSGQFPEVRIGMHMGEILMEHDDRVEIVSRHVNRAHRVMELAEGFQILASRAVVDAGQDFVESVPGEFLHFSFYGEFYLKGVGAIEICEVTDLRINQARPFNSDALDLEDQSIKGRLELFGYRDLERIGEGGSSVVYRSIDPENNEPIAIKVLPPFAIGDKAAIKQFENEVNLLAQLNDSGLGKIRKNLLSNRPPCIVMDYIEGQSLDVALQDYQPAEIAKIFLRICSALSTAHDRGLIHRDLKPQNILVDSDDNPYIVDFGLAVSRGGSTTTGISSSYLAGTPEYLAPEQINGEAGDPRTDIYSLGVIIYRLLAGRTPYCARSIHEILDGHLYQDPVIPSRVKSGVDENLQRICLKAMEKDPERRYESLAPMADDLQRVIDGERVRVRPSVYDNLLFNRARQHITQVEQWEEGGFLGTEEKNRILSAYDSLLKRGLAAVMEFRRLRPTLGAVYIGGWLAVTAAFLWTTLYWDDLSSFQRLAIGSTPFLFTGIMAWIMHRLEHFHLLFMIMIVLILATPLIGYVWVHEFSIGSNLSSESHVYGVELFEILNEENPLLCNRQLVIISFISFLVALAIAWYSGTTTHSAQLVICSFLLYTSLRLWGGMRYMIENGDIANVALSYLPLFAITILLAYALSRHPNRERQLIPWVYFASILTVSFCIIFPIFVIQEWSDLSRRSGIGLTYLLASAFGIVMMSAGFALRWLFEHRGGGATHFTVFTGAACFWWFLLVASWEWPSEWVTVTIFQKELPLPAAILPLGSLAVTMVGCWRQLMSIMLLGLLELAASVFVLGFTYFEEVQKWPAFLLVFGIAWFFVSLLAECLFPKGNQADDFTARPRL